MKTNKTTIILAALTSLFLVCRVDKARAQTAENARLFTIDAFFEQIMRHHPVAKQAALLPEQARQEIRLARGSFDPSLQSYFNSKEYTGKEYYQLWDSNLKIPTWFGSEIKAGFENNSGQYLNPQNYTPREGLLYAGISVPIGQSLLIDQRRATLWQAKLATGMLEAERVKLINKLLLQASKDYWDWYFTFQQRNLYATGLKFATERRKAVTERAAVGDLAAIDTIEAGMEARKRTIMLQEAEIQLQNSRLLVSNYLWNDNLVPVELPEDALPSALGTTFTPLEEDSLRALMLMAQNQHPDLLKLQAKSKQLEIDRRLQSDKFKPKLNAEYYVLRNRLNNDSEIFNNGYLMDNYKFGLSFSYPLLLRAERGKYQLIKLKLQDNDLETQQKRREIENQILSAYNQWQLLEQQLMQQEKLVKQSAMLRDAEVTRFNTGESSLFLTNSREMSLLTNEIKYYELKAKYAKNKIFLQWAAGHVR